MKETIDDISLIKYIDSGCFAETYLSKKEGSNMLYPTKKIDLKYVAEEPFLKKYIENEIVILNEIHCCVMNANLCYCSIFLIDLKHSKRTIKFV